MPQVDFYVLETADKKARDQFVCRLADKLRRLNKTLLIALADSQHLEQLDTLLWAYPPESFLPHSKLEGNNEVEPILLTDREPERVTAEVYLNLRPDPPQAHSQLNRLVEVVLQQPGSLQRSRQHYKFYRQQGYSIQSHNITTF